MNSVQFDLCHLLVEITCVCFLLHCPLGSACWRGPRQSLMWTHSWAGSPVQRAVLNFSWLLLLSSIIWQESVFRRCDNLSCGEKCVNFFLFSSPGDGYSFTTISTSHCALIPQICLICIRRLCQQKGSQHSAIDNILWQAMLTLILLSLSCGKVSPCLLHFFCPILRFCCVQSSEQLLLYAFLKKSCCFSAIFETVPSYSPQQLIYFIPFSDSVTTACLPYLKNAAHQLYPIKKLTPLAEGLFYFSTHSNPYDP